MNGEDTYVIIDLSRIGELDKLCWVWVHAQLTRVFRQGNLSALVHHQVGSSKFSTSSSSLHSTVISGGWLFIQPESSTITLCHRGQRPSNSFSYLQGLELLHVTSIHPRAPPLPFPWKNDRSTWVSSELSSVLPFMEALFCMGELIWGGIHVLG